MHSSKVTWGRRFSLRLKRFIDRVGAAAGLLIISPILLVVGLWVLCRSGAPILHRDQRVGLDGQTFFLLKFRTLRVDTETHRSIAPEDDDRITPAGRFLRRWRFDELPQLLNVLYGDMSLVGPRPMQPAHVAALPAADAKAILAVAPGITGPVAIAFLAEDTVLAGRADAEALYLQKILPAKAKIQIDYIHHWRLREDLKLLLQTFTTLWSPGKRQRSADMVQRLLD